MVTIFVNSEALLNHVLLVAFHSVTVTYLSSLGNKPFNLAWSYEMISFILTSDAEMLHDNIARIVFTRQAQSFIPGELTLAGRCGQ